MCILIIELVWVEKYGKWEKNDHLWAFSRGGTGTGTKQSGTGTISVMSFCFGQVLVFWP